MTTAAALEKGDTDTPLARARMYLSLFPIMFCEFFEGPISRWVPRAVHAKAAAWLCAVEALVRRIMLHHGAAIATTLPPAAAKRAARRAASPPKPALQPAPEKQRPPVFCAFRAADCAYPVRRAAGAPSAARSTPCPYADVSSVARRYEALVIALANPDGYVRRVALRLRAIGARGENLQVFTTPHVHPEHRRYIKRDLLILHEDANDALRRLFWNSS